MHVSSRIPKVLCPWVIEVFMELFIRHLLSASSWKLRGLFPCVAMPRTTGRRQETFHSATKVRWMTTLSYWDMREEGGGGHRGNKNRTGRLQARPSVCFVCPISLASFSWIPGCICIPHNHPPTPSFSFLCLFMFSHCDFQSFHSTKQCSSPPSQSSLSNLLVPISFSHRLSFTSELMLFLHY